MIRNRRPEFPTTIEGSMQMMCYLLHSLLIENVFSAFIYLSIHIYVSMYLFLHLSIQLSIYRFICPFISSYISTYSSIYFIIYLSIHLFIYIAKSIYLSIYFIILFIHLVLVFFSPFSFHFAIFATAEMNEKLWKPRQRERRCNENENKSVMESLLRDLD